MEIPGAGFGLELKAVCSQVPSKPRLANSLANTATRVETNTDKFERLRITADGGFSLYIIASSFFSL